MAQDHHADAYSREAALEFPLMPSEHERAWRYVFDWSIAGDALNCVPGDLVLEFGAGPSFASELFNRLGYRSVALDLNPEILAFGRQRWTVDQRLEGGRAYFVAGDGLRLPFADASFDGIVCLNALHHMPDYAATLTEMRRILKPGARAAFSEPGSLHAETPEAKLAAERGALERSVHVDEIERLARAAGFTRMLLKPYVYPYLVELDVAQFRRYGLHLSRTPFTQPDQIAGFVRRHHLLFVLQAPGHRPITSAHARGFGALRADLTLADVPEAVRPGDPLALRAVVTNVSHCIWLSAPRRFGANVALGAKLCRPDGQVITDAIARTPLPRDIAPGERVELDVCMQLPWVDPGPYRLKFDLLAEQVGWFEQFGSQPAIHPITVLPGEKTSARPNVLRAALRVEGVPTRLRPGELVRAAVAVRNVGDSRWLSAEHPEGGQVTLGMKLCDARGVVCNDALGRTFLPHDVPPGGEVEVACAFVIPADFPAGTYGLRFDMVHERIAWFEQYGSPPFEQRVEIEGAPLDGERDG